MRAAYTVQRSALVDAHAGMQAWYACKQAAVDALAALFYDTKARARAHGLCETTDPFHPVYAERVRFQCRHGITSSVAEQDYAAREHLCSSVTTQTNAGPCTQSPGLDNVADNF